MTITIYRLTDARGDEDEATTDENNFDIVVGGYGDDGEYRQFDGDAGYLSGFAELYGMKATSATIEVDLDKLSFT